MSIDIEPKRGGQRIVGSGGGGKGGGGSARSPVELPDSLHNTAYAVVLDVIGNGEMAGPVHASEPLRDIFLDGTPIQNEDGTLNFRRVQVDYRVGTQDQEPIAGFPAGASVSSVGLEVGTTTPWTQLLTNPDLSAVRISLHWPQLLTMVDSGKNAGDRTGTRVEYAIDLAMGSGSFENVLTTAVDGKTVNGYTRTHRIELPASRQGWRVRVRRLSPEPASSAIQSRMMVQSYAEVIDGKFRYPMTAMVGLKIDAEQFQSIPARAYRWRGQLVRVPSNYDPQSRTYSGIWDGTFKRAWTNNPAWVFYDMLTNKLYGLGERLNAAMIDRYALYQIGAYCDEQVSDGQGGTEPRFVCNAYLQSSADALRVVNDLASVFRGMSYWANGQVIGVADMPSDPVYTYTNARVTDGQFKYIGADLGTIKTVALVSWSDPDDFYRAKVEVVQDEDGVRQFGIRKTELTAFGCTTRGQAQRVGLYHLYTARMEQGGVSFTVGLDGVIPQPGSLVKIADRNRAGRRLGGLVKQASSARITLDAAHPVKAGDQLTVNLPNGQAQSRTVSAVDGAVVTVHPPYSATPQAESGWAVDSDDLRTQQARVIAIKERDGMLFDVSAVFHHPGKFKAIDNGVRLEPLPVSVVPPRVQSAPKHVQIREHYVVRQGVSRHIAEISWQAADHAVYYDVQWRRDNSGWVQVPRTGAQMVEIPDFYTGDYLVRVRAINALDVPSLWAYSPMTTLSGLVGEPAAVSHLTTESIPWGVTVRWGFPTGPSIADRVEIRYSTTESFADGKDGGSYAYPTDSMTQSSLAVTAQHYYWARIIDKNGTQGPWYPADSAPGVRGIPSQIATEYNDLITQEIVQGGLGELIMGDIRDIPNIRDAAGEAAAGVGLNAAALAQEKLDRAAAVAAEAQARLDGDTAAAQTLATGLVAEAQARGAAISQEKTERQQADNSLAGQIDSVTAAVGANTAAIQQEAQARASADSAEANQRQMLAAQLRGGHEGSDLNGVTSGLIAQEKAARTTQYEGLARQMTLLSAGVGEQFDYARMWYFTGSVEGWSRVEIVDGSWIRPSNLADPYIVSPRALGVNGAEYTQARLRLRRVGNPVWQGFIGFYAPGATGGAYTPFDIPEPTWDADGIGMCVLSHAFLSEIDGIIFRPCKPATQNDHFLIDWIAVGRPAPGASSSALASESQARATADAAEATRRETLSVKLTGKADPAGVTLPGVTSGLIYDERQARVSGDEAAMTEISGLKARMPAGNGKVATEASVTAEAQARATADSALAQRAQALEARMPAGSGKVATADAVNQLEARVQTTESGIESTSGEVTRLSNKVDGLVAPAGNLLKNSNVERVRVPEAYAMGGYNAVRPLESGKTYTLVSCITHQPAEGETVSSVGAWAGTGTQAISTSLAKNAVREVSVRKFVRSGQNLSSTLISFYYFPGSVKTGNATVHWACLYEGDVVPPLEWQPSIEEINAGLAGNVEAVGGLTTRVATTEEGLTAQGRSITKIDARLASGQDSDSLLPDYLMANPDCWFSHYGTELAPRFVTTDTGKIGRTVFRHTSGPSFNYSGYAVPTEGRYRIRFWVRRSANADGKVYVTLKFVKPDGSSGSADYTSVELTGRVPADEQWHLIDYISETTAANKALYARTHYGFAVNHTGTQGWAEMQGFRVTQVIGSGDINPNEVATAQSVSTLSGTVIQQGQAITSQGQAVTALQNQVNSPSTGLVATSGALNDVKTRVTSIEGLQQAQTTNQLVLNAEIKRLQSGEDSDLERVLNQWQTQAALAEFKNVQADENRALAESVTTLKATIGDDSAAALAAVEEIKRAVVEVEGQVAKVSASWGVKLQANANGVRYVSGVGLDLTNESGVMQSTFAVLADRFAVMHAANSNPVTVFSVQNGTSILNTALIGYASIGQAHIADAAISRAKVQWAAIGEGQIENAAITNAKIRDASITSAKIADANITRAKIGYAEIDTLRLAGNSVAVQVGASAPALGSGGHPAFRDIGVSLSLPYFAQVTITADVQSTVRYAGEPPTLPGSTLLYINGSVVAEVPGITDAGHEVYWGGGLSYTTSLAAGSYWIVLQQKASIGGVNGVNRRYTAAGMSIISTMR